MPASPPSLADVADAPLSTAWSMGADPAVGRGPGAELAAGTEVGLRGGAVAAPGTVLDSTAWGGTDVQAGKPAGHRVDESSDAGPATATGWIWPLNHPPIPISTATDAIAVAAHRKSGSSKCAAPNVGSETLSSLAG